jgi:hypothetical protein
MTSQLQSMARVGANSDVVVMVMSLVMVMMMLMWNPRILAEHERLDRHGHGEGRHTHAAQIDVVEVP